jgi:hypothetical protein
MMMRGRKHNFGLLIVFAIAFCAPIAVGQGQGQAVAAGAARNTPQQNNDTAAAAKTNITAVAKRVDNATDYGNWTVAQLRAMTAPWKLNATRAAALGMPQLAGKMAICVAPYAPDVYCDPKQPSDTFSGYVLKVFEQVSGGYVILDPRRPRRRRAARTRA